MTRVRKTVVPERAYRVLELMVVLMNPSTQPWTVPSPAEKRAGLGNGLQPFPIKKTDYYKTIDLRNSTELGRGRASWGEYDAMQ